jgi:hypothetical protein
MVFVIVIVSNAVVYSVVLPPTPPEGFHVTRTAMLRELIADSCSMHDKYLTIRDAYCLVSCCLFRKSIIANCRVDERARRSVAARQPTHGSVATVIDRVADRFTNRGLIGRWIC